MKSSDPSTQSIDYNEFLSILQNNPGLVLIKFGADWCKPCKVIKKPVHNFFIQTPSNIKCYDLNVDECDELYGFLRKKRMISGIPTILCYKRGTTNYVPDDTFSGTNLIELDKFFKRCAIYSHQ